MNEVSLKQLVDYKLTEKDEKQMFLSLTDKHLEIQMAKEMERDY